MNISEAYSFTFLAEEKTVLDGRPLEKAFSFAPSEGLSGLLVLKIPFQSIHDIKGILPVV